MTTCWTDIKAEEPWLDTHLWAGHQSNTIWQTQEGWLMSLVCPVECVHLRWIQHITKGRTLRTLQMCNFTFSKQTGADIELLSSFELDALSVMQNSTFFLYCVLLQGHGYAHTVTVDINGSRDDNTALREFKCKAGRFKMLALMKQWDSRSPWKEVYSTFPQHKAFHKLYITNKVYFDREKQYNVCCVYS